MNPMQTKLEQAYKEYLEYKQYTERESKPKDDLRTLVAERVMAGEDNLDVMFEIFGENQILKIDLLESQKKLYYYIQAFKDFVEIPDQILEAILNFKIPTAFAIKNGKKEIVDLELYESYKNKNKEYVTQVMEIDKLIKNSK